MAGNIKRDEIDTLKQAYGKRVVFPNGVTLRSTWYNHPWLTPSGKLRREQLRGRQGPSTDCKLAILALCERAENRDERQHINDPLQQETRTMANVSIKDALATIKCTNKSVQPADKQAEKPAEHPHGWETAGGPTDQDHSASALTLAAYLTQHNMRAAAWTPRREPATTVVYVNSDGQRGWGKTGKAWLEPSADGRWTLRTASKIPAKYATTERNQERAADIQARVSEALQRLKVPHAID